MTVRRYSVVAALAICISTAGFFAYRYLASDLPDGKEKSEAGHRRFLPKIAKATTHLYFSDADHSYLTAESRSLALPDNVVERAKTMVYALIEGPKTSLAHTLPEEAKLLSLYVTEGGVAYVNFNKAIGDKHPGGSLSELLTIFSVVNTLALNIPEIQAVGILIEGREAKTLAGHVDIRFPFRPDLLMVK
jgi:spore germination protein GerM